MKKPVLVTTEFRGVFFGDMVSFDQKTKVALLKNAQNCIYWSQDVRGVFGLAISGPTRSCRIGPVIKKLHLEKVTSISDCSKIAEKAWKEMS